MKKLGLVFLVLLVCTVLISVDPLDVAVDGHAFLESETDHSGIRVICEATSPSGQSDTTFTDATGYYNTVLSPAFYVVKYFKEGFQAFEYPEMFLAADTTLPDVTLLSGAVKEISGDVSGVWRSDTTYIVVGNVELPAGSRLLVEPGTTVNFDGDYRFTITGVLTAQGTVDDSIRFTSNQSFPVKGDWDGVYFHSESAGGSVLNYCILEYGGSVEATVCFDYTQSKTLRVLNSSIRRSEYHGIQCVISNPIISQNVIRHNSWDGIYCGNADPLIMGNEIRNNSWNGIETRSGAAPEIYGNIIYNNQDWGIYCDGSSALINTNLLFGNRMGIISFGADPIIYRNVIYDNDAAGIYCDATPSPTISGNTIYDEIIGIQTIDNASPSIMNNIIFENITGIMAESEPSLIAYNNIYANNTNFSGDALPPYIGELLTVNVNGDSADTYLNIYLDPLMTDPDSGDFYLTMNSPCIDAGDPGSMFDPDSTIADIGAIYYNQGAPPPISDFTASTTVGEAPLQPSFTSTASGSITDYFWEFGDGYTSILENPYHVYTIPDTYTVSLTVEGPGGASTEIKADYIIVSPAITMDIRNEDNGLPRETAIFANYPNPFNPATTIEYHLDRSYDVNLAVFNILGQPVKSLVSKRQAAGVYNLQWNGRDDAGQLAASGIYIYRIDARSVDKQFVEVRKMILMK